MAALVLVQTYCGASMALTLAGIASFFNLTGPGKSTYFQMNVCHQIFFQFLQSRYRARPGIAGTRGGVMLFVSVSMCSMDSPCWTCS